MTTNNNKNQSLFYLSIPGGRVNVQYARTAADVGREPLSLFGRIGPPIRGHVLSVSVRLNAFPTPPAPKLLSAFLFPRPLPILDTSTFSVVRGLRHYGRTEVIRSATFSTQKRAGESGFGLTAPPAKTRTAPKREYARRMANTSSVTLQKVSTKADGRR
jgi:hypothetical protein